MGFTTMLRNISGLSMSSLTTRELSKLPVSFIREENGVIPTNWVLTEDEGALPATIQVTEENLYTLEQETLCNHCVNFGKTENNRIKFSSVHRVFIRKRNFQILTESFLNPNLGCDLAAATRDDFRHGRIYEPVPCEKYFDVIKFHINKKMEYQY